MIMRDFLRGQRGGGKRGRRKVMRKKSRRVMKGLGKKWERMGKGKGTIGKRLHHVGHPK